MKKCILLLLVFTLVIGSCIAQKSKFPQGAWQLVQVQNISEEGKIVTAWPMPNLTDKSLQIKIWSEKHFLWGASDTAPLKSGKDTTVVYGGGGTYTLTGTQYIETPLFNSNPLYSKFPLKNVQLVLRNDTLIQTYHNLNDDGTPAKTSSIEKYVRMK